jgi:hypothetical protein
MILKSLFLFALTFCTIQTNAQIINIFEALVIDPDIYKEEKTLVKNTKTSIIHKTIVKPNIEKIEGFNMILTITFLDSAKAIAKKKLDIVKNNAIIKTSFISQNSNNSSGGNIKGNVTILQWSKTNINVQYDIEVLSQFGDTFIYKGKRKFVL